MHILGFSQTGPSEMNRKFGVGIGYNSQSVMGDSVHLVELLFRYRINDKHTLQLYTPLSYNRKSVRYADDVREYTLWGLGLGYDYTFYTYSNLYFFAGVSADYQWSQYRYDLYIEDREETSEGDTYEVEKTYYYWHKVKGFTINPNIGLRLSFGCLTSELRINVPFSKLREKAHSYAEEVYFNGGFYGNGFYPEGRINELKLNTNISANIVYYF